MADLNTPPVDYRMQNYVDPASVASLYQKQKLESMEMAKDQEQIRASQQDRLFQTIDLASKMVQGLTSAAYARQQRQLADGYMKVLATPSEMKQPEGPMSAMGIAPSPIQTGPTPQDRTAATLGLARTLAPQQLGTSIA